MNSDEVNFGSGLKKSKENIRNIVQDARFIEPNFAEIKTPQWVNQPTPSCLVSSTKFENDFVRTSEKAEVTRRKEIGISPKVVVKIQTKSSKKLD